jgi:hypothetical protein
LTESYLVGNRLVKFLPVVLPTHPGYFSPDIRLAALRNRSQGQLIELLQYMEELALLMDEMQYNKYILQDLTPEEKTLMSMSQLTANDTTNTTLNNTTLNDTTLTSIDILDNKENVTDFRSRKDVSDYLPEHSVDTLADYYSVRSHGMSARSSSRSQQFEQKVAAVVAAGENDDDQGHSYSRHVAAVLKSQTQPPRQPLSDDDFFVG